MRLETSNPNPNPNPKQNKIFGLNRLKKNLTKKVGVKIAFKNCQL